MKKRSQKKSSWKNRLLIILLICFIGVCAFSIFQKQWLQVARAPKNQENVIANPPLMSGKFGISIPTLNLFAPVIEGVDPADKIKYNLALRGGVAHMLGTSLPGKNTGNVFIYGHSSAAEPSEFGKVFANLNDLVERDSILLNYEGKSYTYIVSTKKIVEKDDFSVLDATENEILTLMTCWPIGTNDKRLIIIANRI